MLFRFATLLFLFSSIHVDGAEVDLLNGGGGSGAKETDDRLLNLNAASCSRLSTNTVKMNEVMIRFGNGSNNT